MITSVELRHLRYFVAVAEELHFGRAAVRLHIAQPPLSQQIRHLEEELGVTLLSRTNRRVELTNAGRVFLVEARRTIDQAAHAMRMAQRAHRGQAGRLVIGFVVSTVVLPDVLRVFRARQPGVDLGLHQLTSARQVVALREGRLDVGFVRLPLVAPDLQTEVAYQEPIVIVTAKEHPVARRRRVSLAMLGGEPFILWPRSEGAGFHDQVIGLCRAAGFSPHVVQEATEMQTIINLVAAGIGVSLVPRSVAHPRRSDVAIHPLRGATAQARLAIVWRRGDDSPVMAAFLDAVRVQRARWLRAR